MINNCFLNLTKMCNLDCKHCYFSAGFKRKDELDKGGWTQVMDKIKSVGIKNVTLLGGQVDLLPRFKEILKEAVDRFDRVVIQTNATTDTNFFINRDKVAEQVYDVHKDYDNIHVTVSLDDINSKFNDWLRGDGVTAKTHETLIRLLGKNPDRVNIRQTVCSNNDVAGTINYAVGMGVPWVGVRFHGVGRGKALNLEPSEEKMKLLYEGIKKLILEKGVNALFYDSQFYHYLPTLWEKNKGLFTERGRTCPAGLGRLSVDTNGDVYTCTFFTGDKRLVLGNIIKDSYEDIMSKNTEFIEKTSHNHCPYVSCPFFKACGGGCKADSIYRSNFKSIGDLDKVVYKDDICPIPSLLGLSKK